MLLRTMISSALLLFLACRPGDGPASAFSNNPHAVPVALTRFRSDSIAFAQYSGVTTAEDFVIRDAAAWNDLWQRIYATQTPVPPLPAIDFSQEMVIASALGSQPSGGFDVLLSDAAQDSSGVVIAVRATSPGAHCIVTLALTQPIDVARLAKTDGAVRFEKSAQPVDCGS